MFNVATKEKITSANLCVLLPITPAAINIVNWAANEDKKLSNMLEFRNIRDRIEIINITDYSTTPVGEEDNNTLNQHQQQMHKMTITLETFISIHQWIDVMNS